jgi:hypothetical protein
VRGGWGNIELSDDLTDTCLDTRILYKYEEEENYTRDFLRKQLT